MKFLVVALIAQQAFAATWNFSDGTGLAGKITVDETNIRPCPDMPVERNGAISFGQKEIKFSACVDGETVMGISSSDNEINFLMELHYNAEEFSLWSRNRTFVNSTTPQGCDPGVNIGAILAFKENFEHPTERPGYYCLK